MLGRLCCQRTARQARPIQHVGDGIGLFFDPKSVTGLNSALDVVGRGFAHVGDDVWGCLKVIGEGFIRAATLG